MPWTILELGLKAFTTTIRCMVMVVTVAMAVTVVVVAAEKAMAAEARLVEEAREQLFGNGSNVCCVFTPQVFKYTCIYCIVSTRLEL